MNKSCWITFVIIFIATLSNHCIAQSIIINEVSQGADGNKEYIEFLVVDSTANYNCSTTEPPTIDIRHWIIDDNSGYHGANGVASGAIRFSNDPMWSAVPLGTIILVYNDDDINPEISDGFSILSDGTCLISVAISNGQYFESNTTTPGDIVCSYPPSGWVAGAQWTNISLRNGGDCARLVNTDGCEVFSVCWGDVNLNTSIYFDNSASNRVYYFNNGDPFDQSNWTNGCADFVNCSAQDQSPGLPNNSLNELYIGQFNNNCNPISPIQANISMSVDDCNGIVTLQGLASGSLPGYTYEWFNADFSILLGTDQLLDVNSVGVYQLIATSAIGCEDTTFMEVNTINNPVTLHLVGATDYCEGEAISLLATTNVSGATYNWENNGPQSDSLYSETLFTDELVTLQFIYGNCIIDTFVQINVSAAPVIDIQVSDTLGLAVLDVDFINNSNASSYNWDFDNGLSSTDVNTSTSYSTAGTYNVTMVANNGDCSSFWLQIIVVIEPTQDIDPPVFTFPNVFTPNGDGYNDIYFVELINVAEFEATIRNRWGNVVYQFKELTDSWDGRINGNPASEGVYFIHYSLVGIDGSIITGQGNITLTR